MSLRAYGGLRDPQPFLGTSPLVFSFVSAGSSHMLALRPRSRTGDHAIRVRSTDHIASVSRFASKVGPGDCLALKGRAQPIRIVRDESVPGVAPSVPKTGCRLLHKGLAALHR
jgi:hypothetical protein